MDYCVTATAASAGGYTEASVGHCDASAGMHPLTSSADCEAAAAALGKSDTTASDIDHHSYPDGCYYKQSTGELYFNSNGNPSSGDTDRVSLCRVGHAGVAAGGIHSGVSDQSMAFALSWDTDALYLGVNAVDDIHQNPGSGWDGDTLQIAFTNAARNAPSGEMILYNYGLHDTGGSTLHHEDHPCLDADDCTEAAMKRIEESTLTIYEIRIPARSLGHDTITVGMQMGFGLCANDGDQGHQKGWSGWGPYSIVYGKNSPATGLITIVGDSIVPPLVPSGALDIEGNTMFLDVLPSHKTSGIVIDGNLRDWDRQEFVTQAPFRPCISNDCTGDFVLHYPPEHWAGITDQSCAIAMTWTTSTLFCAVKCLDDNHVDGGDMLQIMFTRHGRPFQYNFTLHASDRHNASTVGHGQDRHKTSAPPECVIAQGTLSNGTLMQSAQLQSLLCYGTLDRESCSDAENADLDNFIAENCGGQICQRSYTQSCVHIERDDTTGMTVYEIAMPAHLIGAETLSANDDLGLSVSITDRDDDGTTSRSGWAPEAAAVTHRAENSGQARLSGVVFPIVARYSSFKLNLDPDDDHSGLRNWDCCVQLAEVALYDVAGEYIPGAIVTNADGDSSLTGNATDSTDDRPGNAYNQVHMPNTHCFTSGHGHGGNAPQGTVCTLPFTHSGTSFNECTNAPSPIEGTCRSFVDLSSATPPFISGAGVRVGGDSTGISNDFPLHLPAFRTQCHWNDIDHPDHDVFAIEIAPGATVEMGLLGSPAAYSARHETRWGGACPGENLVSCSSAASQNWHTWTNDQDSAQNVYFVLSPSSSGEFRFSWSVSTAATVFERQENGTCPEGYQFIERSDLCLARANILHLPEHRAIGASPWTCATESTTDPSTCECAGEVRYGYGTDGSDSDLH